MIVSSQNLNFSHEKNLISLVIWPFDYPSLQISWGNMNQAVRKFQVLTTVFLWLSTDFVHQASGGVQYMYTKFFPFSPVKTSHLQWLVVVFWSWRKKSGSSIWQSVLDWKRIYCELACPWNSLLLWKDYTRCKSAVILASQNSCRYMNALQNRIEHDQKAINARHLSSVSPVLIHKLTFFLHHSLTD